MEQETLTTQDQTNSPLALPLSAVPVPERAEEQLQVWKLWSLRKASSDSWRDRDSFTVLGNCQSLSDIERSQASFLDPNKLDHNCSYLLFKDGIEPKWEDEANKNGGRWVHIDALNNGSNRMDEQWKVLLTTILRSHCNGSPFYLLRHEICGLQVDKRKTMHRIAVWIRDKDKESEKLGIGNILNNNINFPFATTNPETIFKFKNHGIVEL